MHDDVSELLEAAERLAASGPVPPAARLILRGATAVVSDFRPDLRPGLLRQALTRLAVEDPAAGLPALAALIRQERDAAIQGQPDAVPAVRQAAAWPAGRPRPVHRRA